jgi:CO dehydrogenase/acetyl-CoA synthase delta subunit
MPYVESTLGDGEQRWNYEAPTSEEDVADPAYGVQVHTYHLPISSIQFRPYQSTAARHHQVKAGATVLYEIDQPNGHQPVTLDTTTGDALKYVTSTWLDYDITTLTTSLMGDSIEVRQGSVRRFESSTGVELSIVTTMP